MHGDSLQGKVSINEISIWAYWQSDCKVLGWLTSLEGINWYFSFFQWRLSSRGVSIWDYQFGWVWLGVSLIHQYLYKESIDMLDFLCEVIHQGSLDLRQPLLVGWCQAYLMSNQTQDSLNTSDSNQLICLIF